MSVKEKRSRATARPARARAPKAAPATAATVPAYIAALPAAQRGLAEEFDALVARVVPGVQRVIKWGMPFYGVEGRGWFVSCGIVRDRVRVTFFQGRKLKPVPPEGGGQPRGVELDGPGGFDPKRLESWIQQGAKLPGYGS